MIADFLTVARKELFDVFAERHSFRGVLIQTVVLVVMTGIVVPAFPGMAIPAGPSASGAAGMVVSLYLFFPAVLAASIAADALAGERERKTLETLLATPLDEASIIYGKAAAAVGYATFTALLSLVVSQVTALVRDAPAPFFHQPALLVGVALGAMGSSLLTASIALAASMWIPVVRSVQQIAMLASAALVLMAPWVMVRLGWRLEGTAVAAGNAALLALGLAAVYGCRRLFRRERFFAKR